MTGRGFSNLPMRHMYAEMNDVVKININMTQEQREILSELVQRAKLALKPRIKGAKKEWTTIAEERCFELNKTLTAIAARLWWHTEFYSRDRMFITTWNRRLECWRNMMVSIFSIRNNDVNLSSSRWSNTMSKHQKDYSEYWFSDDADWGSDRCESLNHFNESIFTWGWRRLKYSAGAWRWARGRRCVPDHRRATSDLLQA